MSGPEPTQSYARLDELAIKSRKTGQPVLCFGVRAQLYFKHGDTRAKRLAAVEATGRYWALARDHVNAFQKTNATRLTAIQGPRFLDTYRVIVEQADPRTEPFRIFVTHAAHSVYPYHVRSLLQDSQTDWPSYFTTAVPTAWVARDPRAYVREVIELCNLLKPEQGTAGLTVISEVGLERNNCDEYWPFLARFTGLDFIAAAFALHGIAARKVALVNWLTILDDGFVEALGGKTALRTALGPGIDVHEWNGGVVIQAGAEPALGDRNMGVWPEEYVKVNRLVRAIRYEDYPAKPTAVLRVPAPLDAHEETLKWIRRFDREGA